MESIAEIPQIAAPRASSIPSKRVVERAIKAFFGGNALVAVIVLALITIFLFREGFGFFGQNLANLRLYRQAGLEYVDIIRSESDQHEALTRRLSDLRLRQKQNRSAEEIQTGLAPFDQFATAFSDSGENLRGLVSDLTDQDSALKEQLFARAELLAQRTSLERDGASIEAAKIVVPEVDRNSALSKFREGSASFEAVNSAMIANIQTLLPAAPAFQDSGVEKAFENWKSRPRVFLSGMPAASGKLREGTPDTPVPWYRSISAFLFGREWDEVKDRMHVSGYGLSGGQQQRLCIARALAVEPEIVLMDEPCSALDPIATAKVEELIRQLKTEYTIVIVTHNMQQAGRCSDCTAFFYLGRLIEFDSTAKIFSNPTQRQTEEYITGRFG